MPDAPTRADHSAVERAASVRPSFHPSIDSRGAEAGIFVLRDGARRPLVRALPEDSPRILAFLRSLPEGARSDFARSLSLDPGAVEDFVERLGEPGTGEGFFVQRGATEDQVIAFGAYRSLDARNGAAIGLAVEAKSRGQGIGTLLLERLAMLAAGSGIERLVGIAPAGDAAVRRLLEEGGFEVDERREDDRAVYTADLRAPEMREEIDRAAARVFTAASLRPLFRPRAVAVVGASRTPTAVGHRILSSLVRGGFNGPVYPVNPKAQHVSSLRCYPSVEAIGEPVDLAVIAIPAEGVPAAVDDCAKGGVKGLIVISAGFAETGAEGRERQDRLLEQVRRYGMRMVGPNCLGLVHTAPDVRLNASFAPDMPPAGSVALSSQSGALGVAIISLARQLGLGLSSFVSIGNKADVSGNALIEYWEQDPLTNVILLYLESFGNPRRFARLARRVGRAKPIVTVKAGRTEAGGRAASSHTAALAGGEAAVDALFRQTGILRADTLVEMFGIARALAQQPLPRGRRVAVLTNAGGPGILCVDALVSAGLEVAPFSDATQRALRDFLPAAAATGNPVDMIASAGPDEYRRAVEVLLRADEVDALIAIYTPVGIFETKAVGDAVVEGVQGAAADAKPVFGVIVGEEAETYALRAAAGRAVPVYPFPEEIGRILGKIADYADWRRSEPGVFSEFADQDLTGARRTCRGALEARGPGWLTVQESRAIFDAAGLHVAPGGVATSADEAVGIADEIGYPVAVKLASVELVHKTEIGGVRLGLPDAESVRAAFREIERRLGAMGKLDAMQGVLVQPMLAGSVEVMLGVNADPIFGPLIAFGLGGIHVEILQDVAFRVAPLTDRDAREMVREIRGYRLLEGYRGHPAADVPALEEGLQRVSRLVEAVPEIQEVDLNPIFALEPGRGYRIVDARIRVAPSSTE